MTYIYIYMCVYIFLRQVLPLLEASCNHHTCLPKMPLRAFLSPSYYVYTPLEKCPEVLLRVTFILVPLLLNKGLEFCKELFDWVEVGRIRRQIQQLDASFTAHLFNSLTVMEGCIVHNEDRVLRWVWLTMVKQLLNKVLKYKPVG